MKINYYGASKEFLFDILLDIIFIFDKFLNFSNYILIFIC